MHFVVQPQFRNENLLIFESRTKGKSEMKILLVEDSRFLRAAIERSLQKAGYEVTTAADGREVLLAARSSLPALVLLDMMLPGLEGTCVLKELKEDASTSHIPVVVLTGLSQKNETKLKKAGAAGFIEKSALDLEKDPDALVRAVASFIGTSSEVRAVPGPRNASNADAGADETADRVGRSGGAA